MKKENIQRFIDLLDKEEIKNKIIDMYIEIEKNRINYDCGVQFEIILDLEGNIDNRYFVGNSTRMDVYEGNAIVITRIECGVDVTDEMRGEITEVSDYDKFVEYLYTLENVPEDEQEEFLENNLTWENYEEFNSKEYEEIGKVAWENNVDYYGYDIISDKIFQCIEQLEDLL